VDLAWKLKAVLKGWGGASLLDSYEVERKPIAIRNLEEATESFMQSKAVVPGSEEFMKESSEGERLRDAFTNALLESDVKRQFEVEGIALGYCYDNSPIVWADGSAPPAEDPCTYKQTSRPGARAPHAWLSETKSLLDVFGEGFVLLQFGADSLAAQEFSRAATARNVPLQVLKLDDPQIADLYQKRLVLVRPDGHVTWRSDTVPTDTGAVIDRARGCDAGT
jgi:hypothetical protein